MSEFMSDFPFDTLFLRNQRARHAFAPSAIFYLQAVFSRLMRIVSQGALGGKANLAIERQRGPEDRKSPLPKGQAVALRAQHGAARQ